MSAIPTEPTPDYMQIFRTLSAQGYSLNRIDEHIDSIIEKQSAARAAARRAVLASKSLDIMCLAHDSSA